MKRSKEMFLEQQQLEAIRYSPDFNKKKLVSLGKERAKEIIANLPAGEQGRQDIKIRYANMAKLMEFIKAFSDELKKELWIVESETVDGVEYTLSNTGDRLNYEDDEVYKELSEKLKDRQELLKLAYKSKDVIFDSEGCEVPKVGVKKPSKEIIKMKF